MNAETLVMPYLLATFRYKRYDDVRPMELATVRGNFATGQDM